MKPTAHRMPLIDALKAIASQLILLHHFASYGPLTATVREVLPGLTGWLYDYGRVAVQIFLVIGGFLAARGLSPQGEALAVSPLPLAWKRYLRLIVPFLAALALAMAGSALADFWMDDDAIPAPATFLQWLAHATLLHGILGVDALSTGVWYIAIDFQLFALLSLLLWLGRTRAGAMTLVLSMMTASLFWFNRDADWDNWAIYFFGSYGLGIAAWWASNPQRTAGWTGALAALAAAALLVDFRLRIALALGTALLLVLGRRTGFLQRWPESASLGFLGQISFSVFLVHFPVLLVVNGLFVELGLTHSWTSAIFGLFVAWTASLGVATLFYRWIESPRASQRIIDWLARCGGLRRARSARNP